MDHQTDLESKIKEATKKSNDAQRYVVKGKTAEQMAPLLPEFCNLFDPSDARFLGAPLDYIIYNGMSKFNNGENDVDIEIVFLDTKTGNASLNKIQKAIEKAIIAGRVRFETLKLKSIEKFNTMPQVTSQEGAVN